MTATTKSPTIKYIQFQRLEHELLVFGIDADMSVREVLSEANRTAIVQIGGQFQGAKRNASFDLSRKSAILELFGQDTAQFGGLAVDFKQILIHFFVVVVV